MLWWWMWTWSQNCRCRQDADPKYRDLHISGNHLSRKDDVMKVDSPMVPQRCAAEHRPTWTCKSAWIC